jgi:hypothetical protein
MRHFTIFKSAINYTGGKYIAETPKEAAIKAAKLLLKKSNILTMKFVMKETSKNSKNRLYFYKYIFKKNNIEVSKNKRMGGSYKFPIERKFVLSFKNLGYIHASNKISYTKSKNNATTWIAEESNMTSNDGRTLYHIYSDDQIQNDLGFQKVKIVDEYQFIPRLGIRMNYYYDKGNFYPYTVNIQTQTMNQHYYDHLKTSYI